MEIKKDILWRVYLCFICIGIVGLCVLGKAMYIQQVQGSFWRGMSDSLHLKYQPIEPERGSIYSEDGNMLSTSVPIFDIYVDLAADGLRAKDGERFKDNIDSLSYCLAALFKNKSAQAYEDELKFAYKNKERYYPLKKKISFEEYQQLRNFPLVRLGRNKSGFIVENRDKRINPYVLLANRTIGLSRPNPKQNVGLELTYDSLLRGTEGQRLVRYAAGAFIPLEGSEIDPIQGKDIVTTLDTYMQDIVQSALMRMMVDNNSLHGTVIIMEVKTGKVKAIANLGQQEDGSYIEDLNYGIGKATEPGSIFKLATLLSLLEDGYVTNESIVDCEGGIKSFHGLRIKDSHLGTRRVTVRNAFLQSSNVAFAKLADQYYGKNPKQFTDHLSKFRLDKMTGIDIVASSGKPTIKTKEKNRSFSATTIPYMAHGYEELVTPLHMLMLYNAVANNGKMMKPYLVNAVRDYGVDVQTFEPTVLVENIASAETIRQARECLRAVVDSAHGTAHRILYDPTYAIAGKTGTAVTANGNKGYNKGNKIYQASFIGYFPADAPVYTMAVVIQNSRESKRIYGADVSGRVFKDISDRIYGHFINDTRYVGNTYHDSTTRTAEGSREDLYNIVQYLGLNKKTEMPTAFWQRMLLYQNDVRVIENVTADLSKKQVPNVEGMGLKDALYLLENKGLQVQTSGRGKVISQSLVAGTSYRPRQTIAIILN